MAIADRHRLDAIPAFRLQRRRHRARLRFDGVELVEQGQELLLPFCAQFQRQHARADVGRMQQNIAHAQGAALRETQIGDLEAADL